MKDTSAPRRSHFPTWNLRRIPEWLRPRHSDVRRNLVLWVVAGLACGLVAVAFHHTIAALFGHVLALSDRFGQGGAMLVLIVVPTLGGLVSGIISTKIDVHAAGGGIPQVKTRYMLEFGVFRMREAFWRFWASAVSIGSGMALGPEGPTVHMCSAVASRIGQYFGLAKHQVRMMVPVGAGAGLAAVFNAPLAGMFFVYEELIGDLSSKALFGILVAVVTAAIVERTILGENPLFTLDLPDFETSWWMLLCIPLGIVCAALGTLFVRSLLALRQRVRLKSGIPAWLRPAVAGLMIGLAGVMAFQLTGHYGVFSTGYADLSLALNGRLLVPYVVLILLAGKCFAYVVAATAGTSGGIFAPVLFMGGMTGALVGLCGQMLFGCGNDVVGAVALMGMGALFASVIRCPLASFMIVFEMTHNYTIMLPLMAGNIIAYVLSVRWHPISLYDSMLLQDRITIRNMPAYQGGQDWHNLPVKAIMTFDVVSVDGAAGAADNLARIASECRSHHAYPVLDESGIPCGMITHSELNKLAASGASDPVMKHVDRSRLVSVSPETSIHEVASVLVKKDVLQVPVVQQAGGRILGIVTLHDIARQQNAIEEGV